MTTTDTNTPSITIASNPTTGANKKKLPCYAPNTSRRSHTKKNIPAEDPTKCGCDSGKARGTKEGQPPTVPRTARG
eukprot:8674446-Pyramimonas_sp.AAC.1